jgi:hypothetical protein
MGGIIGGVTGGMRGGIWGAVTWGLAGVAIGATAAPSIAIGGWLSAWALGAALLTVGTHQMYRAYAQNFGLKEVPKGTGKKIAVVTGPIGFGEWLWDVDSMAARAIPSHFVAALRGANHDAELKSNVDEDEFAKLCKENDIVVVVSHGIGASMVTFSVLDSTGNTEFAAIDLNGDEIHDNDRHLSPNGVGRVRERFVTANEMEEKDIGNSDLVLVAATCITAKSPRFGKAVGAGTFVGTDKILYNTGVNRLFKYVVDLLNSDAQTAKTNLLATAPGQPSPYKVYEF